MIDEKYIQADRDREAGRARDALRAEPDELVREIFVLSNSKELNEAGLVSRPMAYFSALIAQLANKADDSAKLNEKLQKTMVWLTVSIFVLTAVMLAVLLYQVFGDR